MLKPREDTGSHALRRARQALAPFPGQALALLALVAVLAGVAASAPLMVASSAQGAWEERQAQLSLTVLGMTVLGSTISPSGQGDVADRVAVVPDLEAAVEQAASAEGLGESVTLTQLQNPATAVGPGGGSGAQLISRTGAADAVEVTAGAARPGQVLVPQELADEVGAGVGDQLTVAGAEEQVELTVGGVYADVEAPLPDYWDGQGYLFLPRNDPTTGGLVFPPPVLITDQATALDTAAAIGTELFVDLFFPPDQGADLAGARAAAAGSEDLQLRLAAPDQGTAQIVQGAGLNQPVTRTALPSTLVDVDATVELLSPPVRAVGAGGALAALALVGAWAGARARRREGELRALVARGLSPARGGAQAALEAAVPVLGALVAGGLLGWSAVVLLGPSPRLPADALTDVVVALLVAGAAAVALVAVVTAAAVARLGRVGQGPAAQLAGRIPWLPVLAAVTVVVAAPLVLGGGGGPSGQVDLLALVVPLLVVVVAAGAVVAVLQRLAPRLAGAVRRLPPAGFLAARRVLTGPGATRLVVVTTALALGLVTYAGALADSTARTVAVKASVATGSDVVVDLPRGQDLPDPTTAGGALAAATVVGLDQRVTVLPGETTADVLAVRPGQLPGVLRWNESLSDQPLEQLLDTLDTDVAGEGGRVPVIAAGGLPTGPTGAVDGEITIDLGGYQVPAQVVARADAFPGQSSLRPLLVAPVDAYAAAVEAADRDPQFTLTRQLWARGQVEDVTGALAGAGLGPVDLSADVRTTEQFQTRPELVAQTWSLGYLRAVALAAGLLGLVGLALHAAAQARQRTVAVLLTARMGMTTRATATAAALETGLVALLSALVAVVVAVPASVLVLGLLDPVPDLPPEPLFALPWASIALVVAGAVTVAAAAGVLAAHTARTASPGQVMRDAD